MRLKTMVNPACNIMQWNVRNAASKGELIALYALHSDCLLTVLSSGSLVAL